MEDFIPDDSEIVLPPGSQPWLPRSSHQWLGALIDTARLITLTEEYRKGKNKRVWLKKQIVVQKAAVDGGALDRIESALVQRLNL